MSILWDVGNYTKIKEIGLPVITSGTQNMGNGVYKLKAGTPLDEDGAVSNDGDAVCLVAEDFFFYSNNPTQPKLVKVIETGYVDLNKAEAAAGITYDDACVAALATAGIILVDGALQTGGGGGGESDVVYCEVDEVNETSSMTNTEIAAAITAGKKVLLYLIPNADDPIVGFQAFSTPGSGDYSAKALDISGANLAVYEVSVGDGYVSINHDTYTLSE